MQAFPLTDHSREGGNPAKDTCRASGATIFVRMDSRLRGSARVVWCVLKFSKVQEI